MNIKYSLEKIYEKNDFCKLHIMYISFINNFKIKLKNVPLYLYIIYFLISSFVYYYLFIFYIFTNLEVILRSIISYLIIYYY